MRRINSFTLCLARGGFLLLRFFLLFASSARCLLSFGSISSVIWLDCHRTILLEAVGLFHNAIGLHLGAFEMLLSLVIGPAKGSSKNNFEFGYRLRDGV